MKGIEKIKEKIMQDAKEREQEILNASLDDVKKIKEKSKTDMARTKVEFEDRTKSLVELYKQKTLAQARLKSKKEILSSREEVISKYIKHAIKGIDFKGTSYKKFLDELFNSCSESLSSFSISCNKRDKKHFEDLVSRNKVDIKITEAEIDGGFIAVDSAGKKIDYSLSSILELRKDKIRQEVANLLK